MGEFGSKKMNQILDEHLDEFLAMDEDSLLSPRVSPSRAVELTHILVGSFKNNKALMDPLFKDGHIRKLNDLLDSLPTLALAYYAADLRNENPWTPEQQKRKTELAAIVKESDTYIFDCLWLLFKNHEELGPTLKSIDKGWGRRDNANDVIRLSGLSMKNWLHISGRSPLTMEYLEQAAVNATELIKLLAVTAKNSPSSPKQIKRRAYTKWYRTYYELYSTGRYLLRHQKDGKEQFPGVFTKSK